MTRSDAIDEFIRAYLDIDCPNCRLDDGVRAARENILRQLDLPDALHDDLLEMRYDWCMDEDAPQRMGGAREIRFSGNKLESLKRGIFTKVAQLAKPGDIVFQIKQPLDKTGSGQASKTGRIRRGIQIMVDTWLGNYPYDHAGWTTMLYLGYRPAPKYKKKKQLFFTHVCQNTRCEQCNLGMFSIGRRNGAKERKVMEFHRYQGDAYLSITERKTIICRALAQVIRHTSFDHRSRKVILTCALGLPSRPLDAEFPRQMVCYDQVVLNYAAAGKYFDHPESIKKSIFNLPTRVLGHPIGHGADVNPRFSYLHDRTLYHSMRTIPIVSLYQDTAGPGMNRRGDFVLKILPEKGSWNRSNAPRPDEL